MVTNLQRIPLSITSDHPASEIIKEALLRRGDRPEVADGRAIALTDILVRGGLLKLTVDQKVAYREYRKDRDYLESIERGDHV